MGQLPLRFIPDFPLHDRLVLSGMTFLAMANRAHVKRIGQQFVESAAGEGAAARAHAAFRYPQLGDHATLLEVLLQAPHRAEFEIALKDLPDGGRLAWINHQTALADVIADGRHPAHPHALAFGGGNLVADAFPGDFALELGEGEQDVEGQTAHRSRRIELLGDRNERDPLGVEYFDHLGEVRQRAGQPVDLIDHHHIDEP